MRYLTWSYFLQLRSHCTKGLDRIPKRCLTALLPANCVGKKQHLTILDGYNGLGYADLVGLASVKLERKNKIKTQQRAARWWPCPPKTRKGGRHALGSSKPHCFGILGYWTVHWATSWAMAQNNAAPASLPAPQQTTALDSPAWARRAVYLLDHGHCQSSFNIFNCFSCSS